MTPARPHTRFSAEWIQPVNHATPAEVTALAKECEELAEELRYAARTLHELSLVGSLEDQQEAEKYHEETLSQVKKRQIELMRRRMVTISAADQRRFELGSKEERQERREEAESVATDLRRMEVQLGAALLGMSGHDLAMAADRETHKTVATLQRNWARLPRRTSDMNFGALQTTLIRIGIEDTIGFLAALHATHSAQQWLEAVHEEGLQADVANPEPRALAEACLQAGSALNGWLTGEHGDLKIYQGALRWLPAELTRGTLHCCAVLSGKEILDDLNRTTRGHPLFDEDDVKRCKRALSGNKEAQKSAEYRRKTSPEQR